MKNILWILLAHYILDFPMQTCPQAQTKGKYFYSLLSHSLTYGLGMAFVFELIGVFTIWKAIVLVGSHIIIDYFKATAKDKEKSMTIYLYIDQFLHIFINILLYYL